MSQSGELFILAGNGPYDNRGCEAIIRGTVAAIRNYFNSPQFLVCSVFNSKEALVRQRIQENDPDIDHETMIVCHQRFDGMWFATNVLKRTYPGALKHLFYKNLKPSLNAARAVLAVGGDNYSLDYAGQPILCTELDDLVVSRDKPLVIWGASVGPFSKDPEYETYMINHLRKVHLLVRESLTQDYLNRHGLVDNVYRTVDPGFLLDAIKPAEGKLLISLDEGAIGINISPLLANYNSNGRIDRWSAEAAKIVESIISRTDRTVYLIPHVTGIDINHDDYAFLCRVANLLDQKKRRVFVIPNTLNAAETKWVISKMALFAGARTHSTIASLSSCIPTLSFGYSVKSRGINQDVYGHTRYCLQASELVPEVVADKLSEMLTDSRTIEEHLRTRIPQMKKEAMDAGSILKKILAG